MSRGKVRKKQKRGFKRGDFVLVKHPERLGVPQGGNIIDIEGDIVAISDMGQKFSVHKKDIVRRK